MSTVLLFLMNKEEKHITPEMIEDYQRSGVASEKLLSRLMDLARISVARNCSQQYIPDKHISRISMEDLAQEGLIGCLKSLKNYERKENSQPETYLLTRMRGHIMDELRRGNNPNGSNEQHISDSDADYFSDLIPKPKKK